ncbi:MAG: lipid biosynthesis B12-binding/radical SAM protein [Desulfuromonadales bacterium]|nr:lipid biosynthesis B12-binding/radical SAM protein [Desulfuromonadales bacterium]
MSKVFLLSTNISTEPYPVYPLGMAIIAGALVAAGDEVLQYDFLAAGESEQGLATAVAGFSPDVICLSLRNIDNVDSFAMEDAWYLAQAKELLAVVRSKSSAPVIVGGSAFTIMPEAILDYIGAEYGVVGEGEQLVCSIVKNLVDGLAVPRLSDGLSLPLTMEQMVSPLYDRDIISYYQEESGQINLQTKRGCPHQCVYCTYPSLEGNRFRPQDFGAVIDDIEKVQCDFGISSFFFTDSVFNDAQGHYLAFTEELARRDLGITWTGFFRPQGLSREELRFMKSTGLYAVELGTDAGCDTTLKGFKKGFQFADVLAVNEACIAEEIPAAHYVMFGGPDETYATVAEGMGNIEKIATNVVFAFSGLRILPGTELHQRAIAEQIVAADNSLLMPAYYFSPHIEVEKMNEMILATFKQRREWIFPPSEGQKRLEVMRRFGYRGLLWDTLVSFEKGRKRGLKK